MSDTIEYDLTGNFGLKKPWLDADDDIWGEHMNENMDLLDNLLVTRGFDASKFLVRTGDTMEGMLTLALDPVDPLDAATRRYVDAVGSVLADEFANYLPLIGGEISGDLLIDGGLTVGGATMLAATPTTGPVVVRVPGSSLPATFQNGAMLAVVGPATVGATLIGIDSVAGQSTLYGRRTNGTQAAPAALTTGDNILMLQAGGYGATRYGSWNVWRAQAGEPWTDTAQGLLQTFTTVPLGGVATVEALRLQPSGNVSMGTVTDNGYRLDVVGTGRFSGLLTLQGSAGLQSNGPVTIGTNTTGQILAMNGPAASGRILRFQTAGVTRWQLAVNVTAESGGNAGSNLDLSSYDDTGVVLISPLLRFTRSTGNLLINGGGVSFGAVAASTNDLSKHLNLFGGNYGVCVSSARMNLVAPVMFVVSGTTDIAQFSSLGLRVVGNSGFNNNTPIAKPTVNGAWAGNTAGKALCTALASYGLITDGTSA